MRSLVVTVAVTTMLTLSACGGGGGGDKGAGSKPAKAAASEPAKVGLSETCQKYLDERPASFPLFDNEYKKYVELLEPFVEAGDADVEAAFGTLLSYARDGAVAPPGDASVAAMAGFDKRLALADKRCTAVGVGGVITGN